MYGGRWGNPNPALDEVGVPTAKLIDDGQGYRVAPWLVVTVACRYTRAQVAVPEIPFEGAQPGFLGVKQVVLKEIGISGKTDLITGADIDPSGVRRGGRGLCTEDLGGKCLASRNAGYGGGPSLAGRSAIAREPHGQATAGIQGRSLDHEGRTGLELIVAGQGRGQGSGAIEETQGIPRPDIHPGKAQPGMGAVHPVGADGHSDVFPGAVIALKQAAVGENPAAQTDHAVLDRIDLRREGSGQEKDNDGKGQADVPHSHRS